MPASLTVLLRVPAGKTVVPELPAEFTPRPQLRQRLDEATAGQVIVVSAPAGSGKTLLLADWVRNGESADRPLPSAGETSRNAGPTNSLRGAASVPSRCG
jgi:hypothetical protein